MAGNFWIKVGNFVKPIINSWQVLFETAPRFNSLTASKPLKLNASKDATTGDILLNEIEPIPTNTFIGNITAGTANPTAVESVQQLMNDKTLFLTTSEAGQEYYDTVNGYAYKNIGGGVLVRWSLDKTPQINW